MAFRGAQIWRPELMPRPGFRIAKPDEISVTEKETVHLTHFLIPLRPLPSKSKKLSLTIIINFGSNVCFVLFQPLF